VRGGLGSAGGGLQRAGQARRRLPAAQSGGGAAPATDDLGEHEHGTQEVKAKLVVVLEGSGEGCGGMLSLADGSADGRSPGRAGISTRVVRSGARTVSYGPF
jgi:hypothetical protein